MKKIIVSILFIGMAWHLAGQSGQVLTLDYCHEQAVKSHPLFGQFELIDESGGLEIKNLNKNYLPGFHLNGSAHYQSEVTKVPDAPLPAFDVQPIDKDWYKITLDIDQMIYDGGVTKQSKMLEDATTNINRQNIEISLYALKDRVDQVYFQILLLQENMRLLETHKEEINARIGEVESGVRNGVVLESNADILRAELMNADQGIIEVNAGLRASYAILGELISEDILFGTRLEIPNVEVDLGILERKRPEYGLFDYQQFQLDAMKKLTGTAHIPKFSAFGQLGYGRPGYDMLNNNFDDFYMVGVRLRWQPWHWNKTKNEKAIIDLNKEMLNNQVESFDKNLRIEVEQKTAEIIKFESLIKKDGEILELRSKIAKTSAAQLEHGVITATEYLAVLRAETEAKLNLEKHKIQLAGAKMDYLASIGEL